MDASLNYRRSNILEGTRQTTFFQRTFAKGIDLVVLTAIYFIGKSISIWLGALVSTVLTILLDSMGQGQSIGKRMMGLQVVEEPNLEPCTSQSSLLRNLPLVLSFALTPFPTLWYLSLFVTVPIGLLEIYLLANIDAGIRLGDVIGNTLVREYDDSEH